MASRDICSICKQRIGLSDEALQHSSGARAHAACVAKEARNTSDDTAAKTKTDHDMTTALKHWIKTPGGPWRRDDGVMLTAGPGPGHDGGTTLAPIGYVGWWSCDAKFYDGPTDYDRQHSRAEEPVAIPTGHAGKHPMSAGWFTYDTEDGFTTHTSETAAKEDAEERIRSWNLECENDRDLPADDATRICWGSITAQATETEHPTDYHIPHFEMSDKATTILRSMESVPRDGTEVLLQVEKRAGVPGKFLVGHYQPGGFCIEDHPPIEEGWYFWNGCAFDVAAKPVGWLPLPW